MLSKINSNHLNAFHMSRRFELSHLQTWKHVRSDKVLVLTKDSCSNQFK